MNFNAIFKTEELNRVEVGAKFTFKAPLEDKFDLASAEYSISDVRVKNEGGMLYAVCDLISRLTLSKNIENAVAVQADCLYKTEKLTVADRFFAKAETVVDDEFTVRRIKRALYSDAQAIVTAVKPQDGFVTVDGEVELNVCLLPFSENSDIVKETRSVPFKFEVDLDASSENATAFCRAEVVKSGLKIYVDEDESATVTASVTVGLEVECYVANEIDYISDAYSKTNELDLKRETLEQVCGVSARFENARYRGGAVCKVPDYSRLNKTVGEMIAGYSVSADGEDLIINGQVRADALFSDSDDNISSKELVFPFTVSLEGANDYEVSALALSDLSVKLKNGEIECDAAFKISAYKKETTKAVAVTNISEGEEKSVSESAIAVYLGKKGDTEWEVIKSLGVGAELIAALNPDIVYPLTGGERIIIYRQK